jgi:hypothetical protein
MFFGKWTRRREIKNLSRHQYGRFEHLQRHHSFASDRPRLLVSRMEGSAETAVLGHLGDQPVINGPAGLFRCPGDFAYPTRPESIPTYDGVGGCDAWQFSSSL